MSTNNPDADQQERDRLAKVYSDKTDGELQMLANDASSLSEVARASLREEVETRGLPISLHDEGTSIDEIEFRELVTIRKFRELAEALLAKGCLDSAGITCFLGDDNMGRIFIPNFFGGVRLRVRPEDVVAANEVLDQPMPDELGTNWLGEYDQLRCPACLSLDIRFESSTPTTDRAIQKTRAVCHKCGYRWSDDESLSTRESP